MSRVRRDQTELGRNIADTTSSGRKTAADFDGGNEDVRRQAARLLANAISLLVLTRGQSKGLLQQAGFIPRLKLPSTGSPRDPANILSHHQLVTIMLPAGIYQPLCLSGPLRNPPRALWFDDWWEEPVVAISDVWHSRRDLILNLRDTDGGAHFDESLNQEYVALSRANALGWQLIDGDPPTRPPVSMSDPVPATVRQIWWELDQILPARKS